MLKNIVSTPTFHGADIQPSNIPVTVHLNQDEIAESNRALVYLEYSHRGFLPPRYYIPISDIKMELLTVLERKTHCPIKGDCTYYGLAASDSDEPIAWAYLTPIEEAKEIADHLAFYSSRLSVDI